MNDQEIFHSFINEGTFTCQMLSSGATQIRQANYSKKGLYFQAFTNLSTGFERIGKLIIISNYMLKNGGELPKSKYLKENVRHDLEKISIICKKIKLENSYIFSLQDNIDDPIYSKIFYVLSRFAKGDRYSNIDFLTDDRNYVDPIILWNKDIDQYLFETYISKKKKSTIKLNARIADKQMNNYSAVYHQSDDGKLIQDIYLGSLQTGITEAIVPLRQLYILKLIRYYVELLWAIEHDLRKSGINNIAFFGEIFGRFYNNDSYLKSQKNWEKFT